MVQIVILLPSGDHKVMKTSAVPAEGVTGAHVARALRKMKDAKQIATYVWKGHNTTFAIWSFPGSKGATNTHQLPPPHEDLESVGDLVVTATGDESAETWVDYYSEVIEGGGGDSEGESEGESEVDGDGDVEGEVEEEEEVEEEDNSESEKEEAESEEEEDDVEEEDDGCYDDGDEAGGGSKRRAPRRRTVQAPEYRRLDMGLKSKLAMPIPVGKRAPRWQTAPELEPEEY